MGGAAWGRGRTFLSSFVLRRVQPPPGSRSKYLRALGAWSSMGAGGMPSTSTIRFIWSTCEQVGSQGQQASQAPPPPLQHIPSPGAHLIGATEEGLSGVHLHQDAAQGPHVNGQVVGCAQEHLR